MTKEEYVDAEGLVCPYCGCDEIEGGSIEVCIGSVTQEMWCLACQRTWLDTYRLTRFIDAEV